jgi:imidazolonepropionase-like amidohydrolase
VSGSGRALLAWIAIAAAGVGACTPTTAIGTASPGVTVFTGATIVDVGAVDATQALVPGQDLVVEGSRITYVGPRAPRPKGATVVDVRGRFLVPGLWDMHVHNVDAGLLPWFVAHGVTGVRDMGGGATDANDGCESVEMGRLVAWRARVRSGELTGPELLVSGPGASGTGWSTSLAVTTPDEARAAIGRLRQLGVDFVKVYDAIPPPAYAALAQEARRSGLPFAGHLPADGVSLAQVAGSGQRSIEHVRDPLLMCFTADAGELETFFRQDAWTAQDIAWGRARFAECGEAIAAFRANGTWLVPTLTVERAKVAVEDPRFRSDPLRRALPASVRAGFGAFVRRKLAQPPSERRSEHLWWETQKRLVRRMQAAGVGILAGTDASCQGGLPGASLHGELQWLVEAGLTPLQALQAATLGPAQYLGREGQGRLAQGQRADIVVLAANPLADIANLRQIEGVVLRGRLFTPDDLARMLPRSGNPGGP